MDALWILETHSVCVFTHKDRGLEYNKPALTFDLCERKHSNESRKGKLCHTSCHAHCEVHVSHSEQSHKTLSHLFSAINKKLTFSQFTAMGERKKKNKIWQHLLSRL